MHVPQNACETPTTTFLGVSPPVRSGCYGGAANPLSHDWSWKRTAYSASHTNLQALRELDSSGESFLKGKMSGCDAQLVLGSPELAPLAEAAEWSDAASDTTTTTEYTPFSCHTEYFTV